jgi:oligosaccharide reducing-end xylanase
MSFKKTCAAVFFSASLSTSIAIAGVESPFEIGTWKNFAKGAVSHTFDDNTAGQTSIAQPLFDAKGFHMTLFTVTSSMNPNWTNLSKAFEKGHEIASHSVTHAQTMPDVECPTSQKTIQQKVSGEKCVTVAYPNCNIPNPQTELKKCYIAGRICDGQLVNKSPSDFYRIGAIMAGSAGTNTASGFNSKADQAASSNSWLVWCHHGVGNDNHGYSNTNTDALKQNLDYLASNRDKFWVESFGNVARYIKERDAVSLTVKNSTNSKITISLTDNLVDSIYNYPLTIRRPLPDGWEKAAVTQNNKPVEDSIVTVNSKKYIMFNAVPDGGDIVIASGEVSISSLVPDFQVANPVILNKSILTLNLVGFSTASNISVSLFNLKGEMITGYTFKNRITPFSVPFNAFSNSAFVVKITNGKKNFVSRCLTKL